MLLGLEVLLAQPGCDRRALRRAPGFELILVQQPQRNGSYAIGGHEPVLEKARERSARALHDRRFYVAILGSF
jgi:hypothetical protein